MRLRRTPPHPSVGIVSNEFFDRRLGRMGGFGWAARTSAECFATRPEIGYRPLLLAGHGALNGQRGVLRSNGVPLVVFDDSRSTRRSLRKGHVSLVLSIDYRPNFLPVLESLPRRPVIIWVRDPRTAEDDEKVSSLRLPAGGARPTGIPSFDLTSLADFCRGAAAQGTRVTVAAPAPRLAAAKVRGTYGLAVDDVALLPNPLDVVSDSGPKCARPRVVFLARLDPIKRPWLYVELARRLPRVEFVLLGQSHFSGEGSWSPERVPDNVRVLGHVDGAEKTRVLRSAWALVNTSIHEGLPVSFLEALHCGTPIVSCQDPEAVTSRFGLFVGRWDGSGLDGIRAFVDATERILDDTELRDRLGDEGRRWVRATHTRDRFASAFAGLAAG